MSFGLFLALVVDDSLQVMDEVALDGRLPSVALPLGQIGAIRGGVSASKDISGSDFVRFLLRMIEVSHLGTPLICLLMICDAPRSCFEFPQWWLVAGGVHRGEGTCGTETLLGKFMG